MRVTNPTTSVHRSCEEFGFRADATWAKLPLGWTWLEATSVAVNSSDQVVVFSRGDHPVMVFESDGTFVRAWGEGLFRRPHGVFIGPDDSV